MERILRFWSWLSQFWTRKTVDPPQQVYIEWNGTELRQGSVLPEAAIRRLGLESEDLVQGLVVVVISHSCDLIKVPSQEPFIEIALGRLVDALQAGCTHAQSPQKLHMEYSINGVKRPIEFLAARKRWIKKQLLVGTNPDPQFELSLEGLETLQAWLAARYRRATFPDALVDRLQPMQDKLRDVGKAAPKSIIGIWVAHDPRDKPR